MGQICVNDDDDSVIEYICYQVCEGSTLHEIGTALGLSAGQVLRKANLTKHHPAYKRARELSAENFESEIINTVRSSTNTTAGPDKLRVDALKWVAARRNVRFNDRVIVDNTSSDGSMSPKGTIDASKLSDAALEEFMAAKVDSSD